MQINISAADESFSLKIPVNFECKIDAKDADNPIVYFSLDAKAMGNTAKITAYIADGFVYLSTTTIEDGETYTKKIKFEIDSFVDDDELPELKEDAELTIEPINEENFNKIETEKLEDGSFKYVINSTPEEIKSALLDFVELFLEQMELTEEEMTEAIDEIRTALDALNIRDFSSEFVITDNYFSSLALSFSADLSDSPFGNGAVVVGISIGITINEPDKEVAITPPSDLDEYLSIDEIFDPDIDL